MPASSELDTGPAATPTPPAGARTRPLDETPALAALAVPA